MKKRFLLALATALLLVTSVSWAATTTHYGFVTPTVGASQNVWGTLLNTIFNTIDTDLWTVAGGRTIAVNSQTSGSNITLTNPLSSTQNITMSNSSLKLILPAMNATASMVPGGILTVNNAGSNAFQIVAQDGSTNVVTSLAAGNTVYLTLLSNATANGTFSFTSSATNSAGTTLGVSAGGTGVTTLAAHGVVIGNGSSAVNVTSAGTAGQVLTSNGPSSDPTYQSAGAPTGAIIMWGSTSCPSGWTYLNGQAISRTTYSALFAVIGTTFGSGDGSTTFNVADMRGYFPRGFDDGAGVDPGRAFGSTQTDAIKSHSVTSVVTDPGHYHNVPLSSWGAHAGNSGTPDTPYYGSGATTNLAYTGITVTSSYTGASETRPVNRALLFCIKN